MFSLRHDAQFIHLSHMRNFQLHKSFSVFLHFLFKFLLIISNLYVQVVLNFIRKRLKAPVMTKETDLRSSGLLYSVYW